MTFRRNLINLALVFPLLLSAALLSQNPPAASGTQAMYNAAAQSAKRKFDYIQQNGSRANPDQSPTELTEREVNAYLASGQVQLPVGLQQVEFQADTGTIRALTRVDFDAITASHHSSNPLMSLFSGVHNVEVQSHASGSGGMGRVHIDSVSIDGVGVPRMALEFFVERYIQPKHPEIGLDSEFRLPYRIDLAQVGSRKLTLTQK